MGIYGYVGGMYTLYMLNMLRAHTHTTLNNMNSPTLMVVGAALTKTPREPWTRKPRVLVASCGSVAALKVPALCLELARFAEVRLVLTENADFFFQKAAK